jgi:hypothetical protein
VNGRSAVLEDAYGRDLSRIYVTPPASLSRIVTGGETAGPIFLRHAELVSASITPPGMKARVEGWTLKQVQGDDGI